MAVLSDADRAEACVELNREVSADQQSCPVVKADLRAAFNAADVFAQDNAASYNSALPLPFRTAASASLKARVLAKAIYKRWVKGV